ncbi:MAG: hypothetical protein LUG46_01950 [Erysipelotrichaceae bacterium]|nr:hypothetical protein [Erysipelotrichaceae bacterium]
MKKLLKVLLVLMMGLSLCACSNNEEEPEEDNDTSSAVVKKVEEEETNVDETEVIDIFDNRDIDAVIERMLTLPTSSTISITDSYESGGGKFWKITYNNTSQFLLACNPDNNGMISFGLEPLSLDDDSGTNDWIDMMMFMTWAIDDSLSGYEAYSIIVNFIKDVDESPSMTKNNMYFKFSEESLILVISY